MKRRRERVTPVRSSKGSSFRVKWVSPLKKYCSLNKMSPTSFWHLNIWSPVDQSCLKRFRICGLTGKSVTGKGVGISKATSFSQLALCFLFVSWDVFYLPATCYLHWSLWTLTLRNCKIKPAFWMLLWSWCVIKGIEK